MVQAQEAQKIWRRLNALPHLGPVVAFVDPSERPAETVLQRLVDDVARVTDDVTLDDESKIGYAPSPWHAAIFLCQELEFFMPAVPKQSTSPPPGVGGIVYRSHELFDGPVVHPTRCYYRGQADARYELVATIDRHGVDAGRENRAMDVFVAALEVMYPWSDPIAMVVARGTIKPHAKTVAHARKMSLGHPGRPGLEAIGRHHGIASSLIDFSADPAVAVFFACLGSKAPEAVVFTVPAVCAWSEDRLRLVVPPPISRRLYKQKGLFIRASGPGALMDSCWQLWFPPDSRFRVLRGTRAVSILPEERWLSHVVEWARSHAASGLSSDEQIVAALERELGLPIRKRDDTWLYDLAQEWGAAAWEMLDWLLWYVVEGEKGAQPAAMSFELSALAKHSGNVLLLAAQYAKTLLDHDPNLAGATELVALKRLGLTNQRALLLTVVKERILSENPTLKG
jgi:hypothetical protein